MMLARASDTTVNHIQFVLQGARQVPCAVEMFCVLTRRGPLAGFGAIALSDFVP
jgi:hypothetical protein